MKSKATLLVVDDNRNILSTLRLLLDGVFARVVTASNPNAIPALLREEKPAVVLLDMNFSAGINSGNEGLYWLRETRRLRPEAQVVLFTAYADIELAVKGIKEGAADFIVKPFENQKLVDTLLSAAHKGSDASKRHGQRGEGAMYWGESEAMKSLRQTVEKVAATDANVIITGENGTGKEMLATELHRLSRRSGGPMVPIDMGAVTPTLFESELFGHVKGAFTDAHSDKPGKFELAHGGTLFLDEIGNLDYALQAKLLTALQRRTIVRIGGTAELPIDVRLVCATNRDLRQMVAQGAFREDLLYRINTIHLHLPPLRERRADIVPLALGFLSRYASVYGKGAMDLAPEARRKLERLPWRGNIRELQHAVEKAVILADGPTVTENDIDGTPAPAPSQPEEAQTLDGMERQLIAKTMAQCEGNLSQVAARLGISRQTLYNKIKRYGI